MQIAELLSIHDSYFESAKTSDPIYRDILGDAYLMQFNPVYRNIRLESRNIGCRYVEAWPEYLLMPFHALGDIIADKKIPYVPSGRLLRAIEAKAANVLATEDMPIPESYHLHEAAHVIAAQIFVDAQVPGTSLNPKEKILKTIVCESFANTVDALACLSVGDEEHRFFVKQNCYMHPIKKNIEALARVQKRFGPRFTFMLTLVSYIHANFLTELMPEALVKELSKRYANDLNLTAKLVKDCMAVRKVAEKLDPLFRIQTTQMYLKLEGFNGEIYDLLDFPFMKVFEANPVFRKATEAMADVVLR